MTTETGPDVVKLSELTDIVEAVPYLLGFPPSESIVAVALRGPRGRLGFTCRLDLLSPEHDEQVAAMFAARMEHAEAGEVMLFLYTSPPLVQGELPRRALVEAVSDALPMPMRDAVLVTDERVWSYLCDDMRCCPPQGRERVRDTSAALTLAAAHALHGDVVLPDRDAVIASVAAVGGITAQSMRDAFDRVGDDVFDERVDGVLTAESVAFLDGLVPRFQDGPAALSHDDAASLALRLFDLPFRDKVIGRLARGDETMAALVAAVARLAQPPHDAPAAAVLAMSLYFSGSGLAATAAAERAQRTNPRYSLAQLVLDCIERQLDPKLAREVWAAG